MASAEAVVCVGDAGINGLATVRALGRRGIPVQVVALDSSPQIASRSRYCRGFVAVPGLGALAPALLDAARRKAVPPVLYVDNDPMLRALAPHAEALAARFQVVDPIGDAVRLTDKALQLELARGCGIPVPRTWTPASWAELEAIGRHTAKRLIAKPGSGSARPAFKALITATSVALARALRECGASPEDVLVQEYIEGDDSRIFAGLCYAAKSRDQCFALSARKLRQSEPGAGVMAVGQAVDVPEVLELSRRLVQAAGARGVLCTEFKRDPADGKYYFVEWNPRPAYFQSLGWRSGFDLAWLAWCDNVEPQLLPDAPARIGGDHYWINLHADLRHLAKAPRLVRSLRTWRPYLGPVQWAVFAADDPLPWVRATRELGAWLLRGSVGRLSQHGLPPAGAPH